MSSMCFNSSYTYHESMKDIEVRYRNIIAIAALSVGIAAMMLPSAYLVSTVFAQSNSGHSLFGHRQVTASEFRPHTDGHDTNAAWTDEYEAIHAHLTAW